MKKTMMTFGSRLPTQQEYDKNKDRVIDITPDEPW